MTVDAFKEKEKKPRSAAAAGLRASTPGPGRPAQVTAAIDR